MRIISGFKDYYDTCIGYGIDPKLVYVRKTEEILNIKGDDLEFIKPLLNIYNEMPYLGGNKSRDTGVIAFCGRAYPFYTFFTSHVLTSKFTVYYELDKLKTAIEQSDSIYKKEYLARFNNNNKAHWYGKWKVSGNLNQHNWDSFLDNTDFNLPDSLHRHFKSPILLKLYDELIINPRLNQYNFASVIDPYQAFQRLSMYVGNNLATQMDPEVHVSDVIKAESHGFDKWSFRKHKADSKKPRKK